MWEDLKKARGTKTDDQIKRESKSDGASVCVVLEVTKVLTVCGDGYRGATVTGEEGRPEKIAGNFIKGCIDILPQINTLRRH